MLSDEQIEILPGKWHELAKSCRHKQEYRDKHGQTHTPDLGFMAAAVCGDVLEKLADEMGRTDCALESLAAAEGRARNAEARCEAAEHEALAVSRAMEALEAERDRLLAFAGEVLVAWAVGDAVNDSRTGQALLDAGFVRYVGDEDGDVEDAEDVEWTDLGLRAVDAARKKENGQ